MQKKPTRQMQRRGGKQTYPTRGEMIYHIRQMNESQAKTLKDVQTLTENHEVKEKKFLLQLRWTLTLFMGASLLGGWLL